MPGLVIYAAVDGGFVVWDPARNYWRDPVSGEAESTDQPRAYQFTPNAVAEGLTDGSRVLCNGLIRDWVSWYFQRARAGESLVSTIDLLGSTTRKYATAVTRAGTLSRVMTSWGGT